MTRLVRSSVKHNKVTELDTKSDENLHVLANTERKLCSTLRSPCSNRKLLHA